MFLPKNNLANRFKTKIYWLLKGPYNPAIFWDKWGKTFYEEGMQKKIYPQHRWFLKKILLVDPESLLEVGCGFGRNIKFLSQNYSRPLKVVGCDFSLPMLQKARQFLKEVKFAGIKPKLIKADLNNLPFKAKSF